LKHDLVRFREKRLKGVEGTNKGKGQISKEERTKENMKRKRKGNEKVNGKRMERHRMERK